MGRGHSLTEYAVPILPSRNLRETLEFTSASDSRTAARRPKSDYMILGRGGTVRPAAAWKPR
jgi:hypothetical protein